MNTINIAIFCSEIFYKYINEKIQEKVNREDFSISLTRFETVDDFFNAVFIKRRHNVKIDLTRDSNIQNYFNVNKSFDLFWIIENPEHDYIDSIKNIIVWLRWLRFKTPFIISAFMDVPNLLERYNLYGLFENNNAEQFLRLPFKINEIETKLINASALEVTPKNLPYVVANYGTINHDINYLSQNNTMISLDISINNNIKIDTNNIFLLPILIIDNQQDDLNECRAIIEKASGEFYSEQYIDIKVYTELINDVRLNGDTAIFVKGLRESYEDLQCILLDWELKLSNIQTPELLIEIKKFFPNTPVYILTKNKDGFDIVDKCKTGTFKDFISKHELKFRTHDRLNKIISDFNKRRTAPFWNALKNYITDTHDAWHTPGHSRGESFRASDYLKEFYNFWGENTFAGDLSVSVDSLGSLLDSSAYIGEAQDKAAHTFGSKHTFFATNGSSTSNKVMLQTILKPGDTVILDRNCHKSMHYGCIQAHLKVRYLNSEFYSELGIFAPPSTEEIMKTLEQTKDAKALILTGCTYDGILINMKDLTEIVKKHNESKEKSKRLKLFIDEAWFAYSGFHHRYMDYSAIRNGADYVTHSTHKVLSAFSQASYMHINDPDFDEDFFREIMYIYTSTSPQYQMIASLDVASMQMEMEGYEKVQKAIEIAEDFRKRVNKLDNIKVFDFEGIKQAFRENKDGKWIDEPVTLDNNLGYDPLKITLDVRNSKLSVKEILTTIREEANIEIEKDTLATITILFTIGATPEKATRLYRILKNIDEKGAVDPKEKKDRLNNNRKVIKEQEFEESDNIVKMSDYFYGESDPMKLADIEAKIEKNETVKSARLVLPYPPGIPVLVPGQIITSNIIEYLMGEVENGTEIHGFAHDSGSKPDEKIMYVVREATETEKNI